MKPQDKITYDDTRDIAIRCTDKLIELKVLPSDEFNNDFEAQSITWEVQDLIHDEINKELGLDEDDNFEIKLDKENLSDQLRNRIAMFEKKVHRLRRTISQIEKL
tara:strand:+ start:31 stop:345 length:315 start_codon:yes stop_codon:yes gene_type:complete